MKRLAIIAGGLLISAFIPLVASAHEAAVSGSMSIVLHLEPNDIPIAGQPTQIHLYYTESAGKFDLADCTCRVRVLKDNKTISDQAVASSGGSATTGTANIIFPKPGSYKVTTTGTSQTGAFEKFSGEFPVLVDQTTSANLSQTTKIERLVILGGGAIAVIAILIWTLVLPRRRAKD